MIHRTITWTSPYLNQAVYRWRVTDYCSINCIDFNELEAMDNWRRVTIASVNADAPRRNEGASPMVLGRRRSVRCQKCVLRRAGVRNRCRYVGRIASAGVG